MRSPVQLVKLVFGNFIFPKRWRLPHSWPDNDDNDDHDCNDICLIWWQGNNIFPILYMQALDTIIRADPVARQKDEIWVNVLTWGEHSAGKYKQQGRREMWREGETISLSSEISFYLTLISAVYSTLTVDMIQSQKQKISTVNHTVSFNNRIEFICAQI